MFRSGNQRLPAVATLAALVMAGGAVALVVRQRTGSPERKPPSREFVPARDRAGEQPGFVAPPSDSPLLHEDLIGRLRLQLDGVRKLRTLRDFSPGWERVTRTTFEEHFEPLSAQAAWPESFLAFCRMRKEDREVALPDLIRRLSILPELPGPLIVGLIEVSKLPDEDVVSPADVVALMVDAGIGGEIVASLWAPDVEFGTRFEGATIETLQRIAARSLTGGAPVEIKSAILSALDRPLPWLCLLRTFDFDSDDCVQVLERQLAVPAPDPSLFLCAASSSRFPLGPDLTLRVLHAVLETRKETAAQIAAMIWSRQPAGEFAHLPDTLKTRALEEPGFAHGLWLEATDRPADPVWKLILQDLNPKNISVLATRLRDHYHPVWPDPEGALLWLRIVGHLSIPEPEMAKAIAEPIRESARWKEVLALIRPQLTTVAEDECGLELLDSGD